MFIDFDKYEVDHIRANTNPVPKDKFHSSSELTKYNSNFNNDYNAARKFERELIEKFKKI